jgi:hypothetical protein
MGVRQRQGRLADHVAGLSDGQRPFLLDQTAQVGALDELDGQVEIAVVLRKRLLAARSPRDRGWISFSATTLPSRLCRAL